MIPPRAKFSRAFSLVEVLAAITIIGIITFLAIPNIVQVKRDGEDSLARARADALNIAAAAYYQSVGRSTADTAWSGNTDSSARYLLVRPYLAFAPATLSDFMPRGYSIIFANDPLRDKATLYGPGGNQPMAY